MRIRIEHRPEINGKVASKRGATRPFGGYVPIELGVVFHGYFCIDELSGVHGVGPRTLQRAEPAQRETEPEARGGDSARVTANKRVRDSHRARPVSCRMRPRRGNQARKWPELTRLLYCLHTYHYLLLRAQDVFV